MFPKFSHFASCSCPSSPPSHFPFMFAVSFPLASLSTPFYCRLLNFLLDPLMPRSALLSMLTSDASSRRSSLSRAVSTLETDSKLSLQLYLPFRPVRTTSPVQSFVHVMQWTHCLFVESSSCHILAGTFDFGRTTG